MGYYDSVGRWINTPTSFQGSGVMPQPNGAWGGTTAMNPSPISIVPINGRPAAEDYPVAPGATVIFIDPNERVTYIKSRDQQGRFTNFDIYDWTKREEPVSESIPGIDYDKIRAMISEEVSAAMNSKQRNYKKETK